MGDISEEVDGRAAPAGEIVPERPPEAVPLTALDKLRKEFQEEVEEPRLYKRFPAHSGRLAGEYKPVAKKALRAAVEVENDEYVLAQSLVRVMIHDPEHAAADERGLVPLGQWAGKPDEDPYGFDHRLAEVLGIQKGTPEEICLMLFEGNDLICATQAGELSEWSIKTHDETLQDFEKGSS